MIQDGESLVGLVSTVTRIGDTIRKPVKPQTPAVHRLLEFLEEANFDGAPRAIGYDDEDREVLSFLPGDSAARPWPPVMMGLSGLEQMAGYLLRYHKTVENFNPPPDAQWHVPNLWKPGLIIRHGDLGPWNTLWAGDTLSGVIDWDFAEPGYAIEDVAQYAWYAIPLRSRDHWKATGFTTEPNYGTRLRALCGTYGVETSEVVDTVVHLRERESRGILELGNQNRHPWAEFLKRGFADEIEDDRNWVLTNKDRILA